MKRRNFIIVIVVSALLVSVFAVLQLFRYLHICLGASNLEKYRAEAISEIAGMGKNQDWLKEKKTTVNEVDFDPGKDKAENHWLTDHRILMKNGDEIIYCYRCSKEDRRKDKLIKWASQYDIFIGRGSDNKWYYTTYHFCIGMLVLGGINGQPDSLASFIQEYYLREFDGKSVNCAEKTFPQ